MFTSLTRYSRALTVSVCLTLTGGAAAAAQTVKTAPTDASPASDAGVLDLFVALDGSKQPQDLGINANMGVRVSANAGVPVVPRAGIGVQVGAGLNLSDAAVHVLDQIDGTSRRTQTYLTLGAFQRVGRLSWAAAYDLLHEDYFDQFTLGQLRTQVGYRVTSSEEVGAHFSTPLHSDSGAIRDTSVVLRPLTQVTGVFSRRWPTGAWTSVWAGSALEHHNVVLVFADNSVSRHVFVYGASLEVPLSPRLSLTGASNLVTPTATGTVDAYLGIAFHLGRRATGPPGRFAPVLPVANNPEFPVDLRR